MTRRETAGIGAVLLMLVLAAPCSLQAGTGGYIMQTSADVGGPATEWVDISVSGTLVTGLADDNAASPMIPLPETSSTSGQATTRSRSARTGGSPSKTTRTSLPALRRSPMSEEGPMSIWRRISRT